MKKVLKRTIASVLSIAALAASIVIPSAGAAFRYYGIGDANFDGFVTEQDAKLVLRYYTNHIAGNNNVFLHDWKRADLNRDKQVSVEDAQLILMFVDFAENYNLPLREDYCNAYLNNYQDYSGTALWVRIIYEITYLHWA